MAGIGDALASMFAGAAGEYAGNRATEIRDEDKARIAEAREMKLMNIQQQYQTKEREATQGWQSGEKGKDRDFQSGESQKDRDFRAQQQAQQIGAQAAEGAKDRASRSQLAALKDAGKGPDGAKKLKGTPMLIKGDEMSGEPTSIVYNYEDGTSEKVNIEDLPGGKNYAANQATGKANQLTDDLNAARNRGPVQSETKADRQQEGADIATKEAEAGFTANQRSMIDRVKAKNPNASDDDIANALRQNPQTAPMFK